MQRRHIVFLLILLALIGTFWTQEWLAIHPYAFRAPPSAADAFTWDMSPQIARRGSCAPGGGVLDQGWRPEPGRYVLSILIMQGPGKWRTIRGRLWLHAADSASRADPRSTSGGNDGEPILYGATDLALPSLFAPGDFHPAVRPPATSTDPRAPGVLVLRNAAANRIVMRIGSSMIPRASKAPMPEAGIELTPDQGVGDGFSGSWRAGDSTLRAGGFFCAGWIDV